MGCCSCSCYHDSSDYCKYEVPLTSVHLEAVVSFGLWHDSKEYRAKYQKSAVKEIERCFKDHVGSKPKVETLDNKNAISFKIRLHRSYTLTTPLVAGQTIKVGTMTFLNVMPTTTISGTQYSCWDDTVWKGSTPINKRADNIRDLKKEIKQLAIELSGWR